MARGFRTHKEYVTIKALKRLASMQAFTVRDGFVKHPEDDELIARIEYARETLVSIGEKPF